MATVLKVKAILPIKEPDRDLTPKNLCAKVFVNRCKRLVAIAVSTHTLTHRQTNNFFVIFKIPTTQLKQL